MGRRGLANCSPCMMDSFGKPASGWGESRRDYFILTRGFQGACIHDPSKLLVKSIYMRYPGMDAVLVKSQSCWKKLTGRAARRGRDAA